MSSQQHSAIILVAFFRALTFGPLIAVSVIILLACLLRILDALSSLSSRIAEDRARQAIDMTIARSMEDGMVQNHVVDNGRVHQLQICLQVADTRQGPRSGNDNENMPEEVLVPGNALVDERVWWTLF